LQTLKINNEKRDKKLGFEREKFIRKKKLTVIYLKLMQQRPHVST